MGNQKRFERALEKLLADRSPRSEAPKLDAEEQRMLRVAQLLRGSQSSAPRAAFVQRLRGQLVRQPGRVSRRAAVLSGLASLAAGLGAGFGLGRTALEQSNPAFGGVPLVGANGRWFAVANVAEMPEGAVRPFTAGALQGVLINRGGRLKARSRICTHMGCVLNLDRGEQSFVCPCHGAEFDLNGNLRYGPHGYGLPLPPLPEITVRVNGTSVEVWSI